VRGGRAVRKKQQSLRLCGRHSCVAVTARVASWFQARQTAIGSTGTASLPAREPGDSCAQAGRPALAAVPLQFPSFSNESLSKDRLRQSELEKRILYTGNVVFWSHQLRVNRAGIVATQSWLLAQPN
jgi:hypothetical protein